MRDALEPGCSRRDGQTEHQAQDDNESRIADQGREARPQNKQVLHGAFSIVVNSRSTRRWLSNGLYRIKRIAQGLTKLIHEYSTLAP
ncbi:MAG: hypothetical protein ACXVQ6_04010, partial [Actinomycetota bacterium]